MMKRLTLWFVLPLCCFLVGSVWGEDMTANLQNLNFELGKEYWNVPEEFSIIPNGGRNGTKALYVSRPQAFVPGKMAPPKPTTRVLHLEPGKIYKVSAWIKANIVQEGKYHTAASFTLHFFDKNGKRVSSIFPIGVLKTSDWTLIEKIFSLYPGSDYCEIHLDLFHNYLGEVWFDSIQIEEYDKNCVYAIAPAPLVLNPARPELLAGALNANNNLPDNLRIAATMSQGGTVVGKASGDVEDGLAKLVFSPQQTGNYDVKLELLTPEDKILDSADIVVAVRDKPARVGIGLDRILRVDGQKFMVLGMYVGQCPDNELAMLQEAGFNTVMPYGSLSLNKDYRFDGKGRETPRDHYTGDENNTIESITEVLDNIQRRNMKIIFNICPLYDGAREAFNLETWQGVSGGRDAIVTKVVQAFQNHPSLLAWYICDEIPASRIAEIKSLRQQLLCLDPDHPSWSVTMHFTELHKFLNTTDIMGTDAYPLRKLDDDLFGLEFAGNAVRQLKMPHFLVGQGFSWAYYEPVENLSDLATWKRYRVPTESEMRSMCLSHAIDGATGFLYYYFPGVTNPNIPIPGYREKTLAAFKGVNDALKKIENWILSGNDIKILQANNLKGRTRLGQFTDASGRRCVVVVGSALGNQAEFELDGDFESEFGLCQKVNGKWQFACEGISSDILLEKTKK